MVQQKLAKNLTVVAYDRAGKPVGVAVNNSCHKEELAHSLDTELEGVVDAGYRPIQGYTISSGDRTNTSTQRYRRINYSTLV